MRKLIVGLLTLLSVGCLLLSGCGMRQCLHTNTVCETGSSENDKPCREFRGNDCLRLGRDWGALS